MVSFREAWYSEAQAALLAELAANIRPLSGAIADIGCWQGASTLAIAAAVAPATVYAVDTWRGWVGDESAQLARERDIEAEFRANVEAAGARNVLPLRMDWRQFLRDFTGSFACVHLDAEHDADSVCDAVTLLLPRMVTGGVLCGDDYLVWAGVREGLTRAGLGTPQLHSEGNLWWVRCSA